MANSVRRTPTGDNIVVEDDIDVNPLENVTDFYDKHKKNISTFATVVVLLVVGAAGYYFWIKKPKEENAMKAMTIAQMYFQRDSLNQALNGDSRAKGFKDIMSASAYSGTPSANLAHYYAGICYLRMNDFKNAIKAFKDFDGKGTVLGSSAMGQLGIAYMESNDFKNAIESFEKATSNKEDQLITPMYLYHLALAYEANKNNDKAKETFKRIKDEYPRSIYARDMDKELARLGVIE